MTFFTSISGLNAASQNLNVSSNNLANANTTGFKKSRAEFADVFAASVSGVSKTQPGSGVQVTNVAQQFSQGSITSTGNNLDLAISGEGFFSLGTTSTSNQPSLYSRAGEFKLDKDGYVVNNQGNFLLAFSPNGSTVNEGFSTGVFTPIQVNAEQGSPTATTQVGISANLQSTQVTPANSPVNPSDSTTYNHVSSLSIYDSLGNAHIASTYYVSDSPTTANSFQAYLFIDGKPFNTDGTPAGAGGSDSINITFDSAGKLASPIGQVAYGAIKSTDLDPSLNAADLNLSFNFTGTTQFSSVFSVNNLTQDGLPSGNLTGISVGDDGVVLANFSNGGSQPLGKVALTRFANPQGLAKVGDSTFAQSAASGLPIPGQPGVGSFGAIQSGSLEASNVDISGELVNLIIGQQAYQANAQAISTQNTITQTILNI
ncbi:MAG: flagellar hook protein FlgE [Methylococcaceae bacterium]|jgi:flagellar hook protein FlgE